MSFLPFLAVLTCFFPIVSVSFFVYHLKCNTVQHLFVQYQCDRSAIFLKVFFFLVYRLNVLFIIGRLAATILCLQQFYCPFVLLS